MPYPIYQYVINLILSLPIGTGPGVFMNVSVGEHPNLNNFIFYVSFILPFTYHYVMLPYLPIFFLCTFVDAIRQDSISVFTILHNLYQ
jgi:hypothetical protein